jgi:putative photosynthetic complex assembly protein
MNTSIVQTGKQAEAGADVGFPRLPLISAAALVLVVLVAVTIVRLTGVSAVHVVDAPAVQVREFRFEDRPDGSIAVFDTQGRLAEIVAPGSNGFLRGTMRGLARERKREGIGPELPFRMVGRADGRLTLEDPGTGRRVDLGSFGPTNAAAFAQLMIGRAALP